MIAITSVRNLNRCTPEILSNQLGANESWNRVFDHIIIFGNKDKRIDSGITTFIPGDDWPKIKSMMLFASLLKDWACIINADIVVSPDLFKVEKQLRDKRASCAMSYRYQFDPVNPLVEKKVVDNGLDIFCAVPQVWKEASRDVPEAFRIGHQQWDTWTIGYFNSHFYTGFFDFTPAKCIYHPKHESRMYKYTISISPNTFESNAYGPPMNKIR